MARPKDRSKEELRREGYAPMAYEDWMGSRHVNALDTSTRSEVVAAITLSEETGRITVFVNGGFEDYERAEIAAEWCAD